MYLSDVLAGSCLLVLTWWLRLCNYCDTQSALHRTGALHTIFTKYQSRVRTYQNMFQHVLFTVKQCRSWLVLRVTETVCYRSLLTSQSLTLSIVTLHSMKKSVSLPSTPHEMEEGDEVTLHYDFVTVNKNSRIPVFCVSPTLSDWWSYILSLSIKDIYIIFV